MTPEPGKAPPPAWPSSTRPSLFSSTAPAHDDGPVSILSAMDDTPPPSRAKLSQRQLWPWLGGGLLAAVGLIWLANAQKAETERPKPVLSVAAASAPARLQAVASAPIADLVAASAPAVIEVNVAANPAPVAPAASLALAEPAGTGSPNTTLLMAAGAGAVAAGALAAAPEPSASAPKKTSKRSKDKVAREAKAAREAAAATKTAQSAAARKADAAGASTQGGADPDVDLIAAVMRHGEAPAAGRGAEGDTTTSSIAGLVSRCKSLGGSEAKACRQRLCEGYWGKAEACPKRLAPKSSAKASTDAKTSKSKKKKKASSSDSEKKA